MFNIYLLLDYNQVSDVKVLAIHKILITHPSIFIGYNLQANIFTFCFLKKLNDGHYKSTDLSQ